MKTVRLLGELGAKFGALHSFAIRTPAEAIRALRANFSEFEPHLHASAGRGVGYKVISLGEEIDERELLNPVAGDIQIVPVIYGSGGTPIGKVIIGAALIAAGYALTASTGGVGAWAGNALIYAGKGFVLAGIFQSISPTPNSPDPAEHPDNKPSYVFSGPVNTYAQGEAIAVCYGRLIVGSAVISAGISTEDIVTPPTANPLLNQYVYGN